MIIKHGFFLTGLVFFCISCSIPRNEQAARAWLEQAEKPVTVQRSGCNGLTYNCRYTLIDRRGDVYFTREVRWVLPDTLGTVPLRAGE